MQKKTARRRQARRRRRVGDGQVTRQTGRVGIPTTVLERSPEVGASRLRYFLVSSDVGVGTTGRDAQFCGSITT